MVQIPASTTQSYPRNTAQGLLDGKHVWNVTTENIVVNVLPVDHQHSTL